MPGRTEEVVEMQAVVKYTSAWESKKEPQVQVLINGQPPLYFLVDISETFSCIQLQGMNRHPVIF